MKKSLRILIITAFVALGLWLCAPCFCQEANLNLAQLDKIEKNLYGFNYPNQSEKERLIRIEKSVFGSTNDSLSTDKRIEKLNSALGIESQQDAQKSIGELSSNEEEGVSYPQIDKLETKLFNRTHVGENIYKRIERLEKQIFGSTQEGDLATRTERLKGYLKVEETPAIAQNYQTQNYGGQNSYAPYGQNSYNPYSQNSYDPYGSDLYIQLAGLEQSLFGKTYSQDPPSLRFNRLERKIFQRDFSSDDDVMRMQRLQAAASAKKTAKYYEMNKTQKFASTGLQIGTILLLILGLIL